MTLVVQSVAQRHTLAYVWETLSFVSVSYICMFDRLETSSGCGSLSPGQGRLLDKCRFEASAAVRGAEGMACRMSVCVVVPSSFVYPCAIATPTLIG